MNRFVGVVCVAGVLAVAGIILGFTSKIMEQAY